MISCKAAVSSTAVRASAVRLASLAEAGCAALPYPPAGAWRTTTYSFSSRVPAAAKNASAKGVGGSAAWGGRCAWPSGQNTWFLRAQE